MALFTSQATLRLIDLALEEDLGRGDLTSQCMLTKDLRASASIIARENLCLCGAPLIKLILDRLKADCQVELKAQDGENLQDNQPIAQLHGLVADLLAAERTILNFLQRLSGIATNTQKFVRLIESKSKLLDTRKTTPGWRALEKYAVRTGGADNHRASLGDMILIKNNHIDALRKGTDSAHNLGEILQRALKSKPSWALCEVEVRNLEELQQVLKAPVDIIMLDNMQHEACHEAISLIRARPNSPKVELSGGINLGNLTQFASLGADFISLGALTHSARWVDISMRITI